jgi:hypothetical protein
VVKGIIIGQRTALDKALKVAIGGGNSGRAQVHTQAVK